MQVLPSCIDLPGRIKSGLFPAIPQNQGLHCIVLRAGGPSVGSTELEFLRLQNAYLSTFFKKIIETKPLFLDTATLSPVCSLRSLPSGRVPARSQAGTTAGAILHVDAQVAVESLVHQKSLRWFVDAAEACVLERYGFN